MKSQEADLDRALEVLRRELYSIVGPEYDRYRVQEARTVRSLLGYREKTAGGIMTPEVTTVTEEMTVERVIEHIRSEATESETIYYIYVVDDERRLDGVISLRDLVVAQPGTLVSDIAERDVFTVNPDDDQEDVAETMSKYDLLAVPVVDETGKLLGIVTVDDALDVMEEESAEDLALATGSAHEAGPLASTWRWLVRRYAWLLVWVLAFLVFLALRTSLADLIAKSADAPLGLGFVFAGWGLVLLPVLLRSAEELSSRTLAELIEGEGADERPPLGRRLLREGPIGLATAIVMGLLAYAIIYLTYGGAAVFGEPFAAVTALAALLTAVVGGVLGHIALTRIAAGKRVSGTALSLTAMALGTLIYLGMAFAAGALWVGDILAARG